METSRSLAARATRFALTYRAGTDSGMYAIFIVLLIVGSINPLIWIACGTLGLLVVARGFYADRAHREAHKPAIYPGYPY